MKNTIKSILGAITKTIGFCLILWATIKVSETISEITNETTLIVLIVTIIFVREYRRSKKAR